MKKKCIKCDKPIIILSNNQKYCKECSYIADREYVSNYIRKNPWAKTMNALRARYTYKNSQYYKKGIKNFLCLKDVKYLWFRDKAYLMERPSIHRIDNNGHYLIDNCKYIELFENNSLGHRGIKFTEEHKRKIGEGIKKFHRFRNQGINKGMREIRGEL